MNIGDVRNSIDAGSFIRLYAPDTAFTLACDHPECEAYYLHRPWRPEDEETED